MASRLFLSIICLSFLTLSRCDPRYSRFDETTIDRCPELPPYKSPPFKVFGFQVPKINRHNLPDTTLGAAKGIVVGAGWTSYSCPPPPSGGLPNPFRRGPEPVRPILQGSDTTFYDAATIVKYYAKMGKTPVQTLEELGTDRAFEMLRPPFPPVGTEFSEIVESGKRPVTEFEIDTISGPKAVFAADITDSVPASVGSGRGLDFYQFQGEEDYRKWGKQDHGSADWMKLKANGNALFMEIYKVKTVGGKGPEFCTPQLSGRKFDIPHVAQYYLFSPPGLFDANRNEFRLASPKDYYCVDPKKIVSPPKP